MTTIVDATVIKGTGTPSVSIATGVRGPMGDPGPPGPAGPPGTGTGSSVRSIDQDLPPLHTAGNQAPLSSVAIAQTPAADTAIRLAVNCGFAEYGTEFYFSNDPQGRSVLQRAQVVQGSRIFWNGVVAGFNVDPTTDKLTLMYEVSDV